jgi:hypothetical protein
LIYDFFDSSLPCPPDEVRNPAPAEGAATTVTNQEYSIWNQQDQCILSAIVSSHSEGVIGMVVLATTSREAWGILEGSFATQSTARVMQIRGALSKMKKLDTTASEFFNKVKALAGLGFDRTTSLS